MIYRRGNFVYHWWCTYINLFVYYLWISDKIFSDVHIDICINLGNLCKSNFFFDSGVETYREQEFMLLLLILHEEIWAPVIEFLYTNTLQNLKKTKIPVFEFVGFPFLCISPLYPYFHPNKNINFLNGGHFFRVIPLSWVQASSQMRL